MTPKKTIFAFENYPLRVGTKAFFCYILIKMKNLGAAFFNFQPNGEDLMQNKT